MPCVCVTRFIEWIVSQSVVFVANLILRGPGARHTLAKGNRILILLMICFVFGYPSLSMCQRMSAGECLLFILSY